MSSAQETQEENLKLAKSRLEELKASPGVASKKLRIIKAPVVLKDPTIKLKTWTGGIL